MSQAGAGLFTQKAGTQTAGQHRTRRDKMQMLCSCQNRDQIYFLNKLSNASPRCSEPDVKDDVCAYKLNVVKLDLKELPMWNGSWIAC